MLPDPPRPEDFLPPEDWEHIALYRRIVACLADMPANFSTPLRVTGALANDLHSFGAPVGGIIEAEVVRTLTKLREDWDPNQEYDAYEFVRQSQKFPDVILRTKSARQPQILMGIEMKGWYVLAKERMPNFRFEATAAVCAPWDLAVICPWALSEVISGTPVLLEPYVVPSRWVAARRNYYWQHQKRGDGQIRLSTATGFYPITKTTPIHDIALKDSGNNFGRHARTKAMDPFIATIFQQELAGIPIDAWNRFLAIFVEGVSAETVEAQLAQIAVSFASEPERASQIVSCLGELASLVSPSVA